MDGTRKVHGDEPPNARWIASQCAARPDLIARVEEVVRDPYGRRDARPLCSWEDWHRGLQLLEKELRRGSETFTAGDYREASRLLSAQGHPFAGPLGTMGSYAAEAASYRQSWGQRYASRARTAGEVEAAGLIAEGHVRDPGGAAWAGVDGARHALVVQRRPGRGGWRPVVLIENSAQAVELVPVTADHAARAWIWSRTRGARGPLPTSLTGPACRPALEDEVLAWLIHAGYGRLPWDVLGQVVWTSHVRAELYRAAEAQCRDADPADPDLSPFRLIRWSFTYWLPFAPGWAVDHIGWPDARHARGYFDRLAVTPVSDGQALRAVEALAAADAEAARRAGIIAPVAAAAAEVTEGPARRLVPGGRRRAVEPGPQRGQRGAGERGAQQPPRRQARPAGPEPRP